MKGICGIATLAILSLLCAACAHHELVLALGQHGMLEVSTGAADPVVLSGLYAAARVQGSAPPERFVMDPSLVETLFGPLQAAVPPIVSHYVLYFTRDVTLLPESAALVETIVQEVLDHPAATVLLIGHTDTVGSSEDNERLAAQRAQAIATLLQQRYHISNAIMVESRGERDLQVPTADQVEEIRNRTVEVLVR